MPKQGWSKTNFTNEEIIERLKAHWTLTRGCFSGWILRSPQQSNVPQTEFIIGFAQVSHMEEMGLIRHFPLPGVTLFFAQLVDSSGGPSGCADEVRRQISLK